MPSSPLSKALNWAMSVPAAKALSPAPVTTSALMPLPAAPAQISARPSYMAKVRALRACGRLKVTQPTAPRVS